MSDYPEHPFPLSADEVAAVKVAKQMFYRVNPPGTKAKGFKEFTLPCPIFDLVEQALSHWPTYDENGEPYVACALFRRTGDPFPTFYFMGVTCHPEEDSPVA